jgi:hypothetical protein
MTLPAQKPMYSQGKRAVVAFAGSCLVGLVVAAVLIMETGQGRTALIGDEMTQTWSAVNGIPEAETVKEKQAMQAFRAEHETSQLATVVPVGPYGVPPAGMVHVVHPFMPPPRYAIQMPTPENNEPMLPQSALQGWSDLLSRVTRELSSDTYDIQTMQVQMKALEHQNAVLLAKYAAVTNMKALRGPMGMQGLAGPEGRYNKKKPCGSNLRSLCNCHARGGDVFLFSVCCSSLFDVGCMYTHLQSFPV